MTRRITYRQHRISNPRVAGSAAIASILVLVLLSVSCRSTQDSSATRERQELLAKSKACPPGTVLAYPMWMEEDMSDRCVPTNEACPSPNPKTEIVGNRISNYSCDAQYQAVDLRENKDCNTIRYGKDGKSVVHYCQ